MMSQPRQAQPPPTAVPNAVESSRSLHTTKLYPWPSQSAAWSATSDDTGVYYTKDEVIAVHVGLHLRGAFSLTPLTSSRGQILCMVMATHYARLFRHLPHAIVLSRYTSHHVAIRNGTGATDVRDMRHCHGRALAR